MYSLPKTVDINTEDWIQFTIDNFDNVQQKYEGKTSNGEPDGKGILSFPDGKRVTGEWKNGKEWNTDHFNNEGKLIGRTAKGKYIIEYFLNIIRNVYIMHIVVS